MDMLAMWVLAGPRGLGHYWKTHYADKTFEHLYRWNAFDTALLIPYFIVMVILAFYGIHRYQLVWLYYRKPEEGGAVGGAAGAVGRGRTAVCDDPAADLQ